MDAVDISQDQAANRSGNLRGRIGNLLNEKSVGNFPPPPPTHNFPRNFPNSSKTSEERLKKLIIEIGDKVEDIPLQIKSLANLFSEQESFFDKNGELIRKTIVDAATAMSVKIGIYATLCGLLNKNLVQKYKQKIGLKLSEKIKYEMEIHLKRGNRMHINNLLRFILALAGSNVFTLSSALAFLEDFFLKTKTLIEEKSFVAADNLLFILLSSLPWISRLQFPYFSNFIEKCLVFANEYQNNYRIFNYDYRYAVEIIKHEDANESKIDRLTQLIHAIQFMKNKEWESKGVFRFYQSKQLIEELKFADDFCDDKLNGKAMHEDEEEDAERNKERKAEETKEEKNEAEMQAKEKQKSSIKRETLIDIPLCTFPFHEFKKKSFSIPTLITFCDFVDKCKHVKEEEHELNATNLSRAEESLQPHDHWLLEEHIILLIYFFHPSVKINAEQILRIPLVNPKFELIATQTVISSLLTLPKSNFISSILDCNIFYIRLMHTIAEMQHSFLDTVEEVVCFLLEKIESFDEEAFQIFAEFLSFWITWHDFKFNFNFFLDIEKNVKEKYFRLLKRVCDRCLRLSYRNNLITKFPSFIHQFILPEPNFVCKFAEEKNEEFFYVVDLLKYNLGSTDEAVVANHLELAEFLKNLIQTNKSIDKNEENADMNENKKDKSEVWSYQEVVTLFAQSTFYKGSKTLAHINRIFDNYSPVFHLISPSAINKENIRLSFEGFFSDEEFFFFLLRALFSFWENSPQRISLLIEIFLLRNIVTHVSVFLFLYNEFPDEKLMELNLWEISEIVISDAIQKKKNCESEYVLHNRQKDKTETEMQELRNEIEHAHETIKHVVFNLMSILIKKHEELYENSVCQNLISSIFLAVGRKYAIFIDFALLHHQMNEMIDNSAKLMRILNVLRDFPDNFHATVTEDDTNLA